VSPRAFRNLYLALAIVAIAPVWSAQYLPTADGPSHLYNSWVLRELIGGGNTIVAQTYEVDWRPHPNWSGHVVLALLMTVVPPLVAEKLLMSGIVLFFLYAIWRYCGILGDDARPFAFLAFPFAYHLLLQMGFYNFSIGVALYFLILAVWWERRDRPDARTIVTIAALLLLCYFSHVMPAILAAGSIGLLCLATLPGRRIGAYARHLIALLPLVPLVVWFARTQGMTLAPGTWSLRGHFSYIEQMWVILTFDRYQAKLGVTLFVTLTVLIVVTFVRRRWRWSEGDAFIVLTIVIIAIYLRAPDATSGGTMVLSRMALFVVLSPLAWLAPRLPRRVTTTLVVLFALISIGYTGYLIRRYRGLSRRTHELIQAAAPLGRNTTMLPIVRDVRPPGSFVPALAHAIDYAVLEKGDVNIANYEAGLGYFPVTFRPGVLLPEAAALQSQSTAFDLGPIAARAEYLFTWHLPPDAPVRSEIDNFYVDIGGGEGGRVYRVRR
jgi:hypothetical protein